MLGFNRNLVKSLYGQLARLLLQAAFFFVLAKILPVSEFGLFALVVAISALLLPFSGLGSQLLLVKLLSKSGDDPHEKLGSSIKITFLSGFLLSIIAALISEKIYFHGMFLFVYLLFLSEVVVYRTFESFASKYQGVGDFSKIIKLRIIVPLIKFSSVIIIYFFSDYLIYENQFYWVYIYSFVSLIGLIIYLLVFSFKNRISCSFVFSRYAFNYKEGLLMSSSLLVYGVFASTDQIMIGSMISKEMVAVYALSSKIYFMLFLPFQALSAVTIRNFFKNGHDIVKCNYDLKRILKLSAPIATVLAIVAVSVSSFLPYFFGEEYKQSEYILIGLMIAFPLKVCSAMISDYLVGIGRQRKRLGCEVVSCLINVVMNYMLIDLYGVLGAVASTFLSELTLLALFSLIFYKNNRVYR